MIRYTCIRANTALWSEDWIHWKAKECHLLCLTQAHSPAKLPVTHVLVSMVLSRRSQERATPAEKVHSKSRLFS